MASPVNQHCANCIGTLSFPMTLLPALSADRDGGFWGISVREMNVRGHAVTVLSVVCIVALSTVEPTLLVCWRR